MIEDKLTTSLDKNSSTISFKNETPARAYEILTDAVLGAKGYEDVQQIEIEKLQRDKVIGTAKYDEDLEKVISLNLRDWVIEEFGIKK